MTIQKIHKCTLIVFPLRIKNLCLVISLFSAPLHRKTSRKLSGCCLYFLTYIHPFPFPISSSVQPGFSPIIKFHWTCCLQSQWPPRCQIQRTFSVFPLVWKQSPFLTSVTISSSGYFPTLLLATPSKFLLLAFPPLPKLKYWYSSGFCLGLSSSFFIQLLLSDFIHSHYFDYYLYAKCPSSIFLAHTSSLGSRPLHPSACLTIHSPHGHPRIPIPQSELLFPPAFPFPMSVNNVISYLVLKLEI